MNKQWDLIYEKKMGSFSLSLDRGIQRNKYFYQNLKNRIHGKVLLDLGCGDSGQIFYYLNPDIERFRYIGLDYSMPSLKLVPYLRNSNFIQFDLNFVPIKNDSTDIIFVFGLLMYFPNYIEIIEKIIDLLKPGGEIYLYESVCRINKSTKNSFISLDRFKEVVSRKGTILFEKKDYSPVRYLLIKVASRLKIHDNRIIITLIIILDAFIIKTFGKIIKFLDGRAVFIKIRKNK